MSDRTDHAPESVVLLEIWSGRQSPSPGVEDSAGLRPPKRRSDVAPHSRAL